MMVEHQPSWMADAGLTIETRYVKGGEIVVSRTPLRLTTVLGSCVSVCLFDHVRGIGGINHIQMPGLPREDDEAQPERWAEPGTELLIRRMISTTAEFANLRAKVFGGACISTQRVPEAMRVGTQNVESVMTVLHRHRIPVVSQSTGGDTGLKVMFDTHSGNAWVKKLVQRF